VPQEMLCCQNRLRLEGLRSAPHHEHATRSKAAAPVKENQGDGDILSDVIHHKILIPAATKKN